MKKNEEFVMVCPKCKSSDVGSDVVSLTNALGLPQRYVCYHCGYAAYQFPEVPASQARKFKSSRIKDLKLPVPHYIPPAYFNFQVNVLWKIIGPLFLLAGIVLFFLEGDSLLSFAAWAFILQGIVMCYFAFLRSHNFKPE